MANKEHLKKLKQGADAWNSWRVEHPKIRPNLAEAKLFDLNLEAINLERASLEGAHFIQCQLERANLRGANLERAEFFECGLKAVNLFQARLVSVNLERGCLVSSNLIDASVNDARLNEADFSGCDLSWARLNNSRLLGARFVGAILHHTWLDGAQISLSDFTSARLTEADLSNVEASRALFADAVLEGANLEHALLIKTDFTGANLRGANLNFASMSGVTFRDANLTGCSVHGTAAWGLDLTGATQTDLLITHPAEPALTLDNLEVAQFVYLILNNERLRDVIDTVGRRTVLILGRFTPARLAVLEAIKVELRRLNYVPILFQFDVPQTRDVTETVKLLAHLSRFVIADLSEPSSIPKELESIIPTLAIPIKPLIQASHSPYSMFNDYWKYEWVLDVHHYETLETLIESLAKDVIIPAEAKAKELEERRKLRIGNPKE